MDESVVWHLEQTNSTADILQRAKAYPWSNCGTNTADGKYCVGQAIGMAAKSGGDIEEIIHLFQRANNIEVLSHYGALFPWNDAPERTHADVMNAFSRAIELAEREGKV